MMESYHYPTVENLPVLCYEQVYKISKLRQELQDGLHDKVEAPIQTMMNAHQETQDEQLQLIARQEETEPRQSSNVESLYNLVQMIDQEMKFAINPPFNGRFSHDNAVRARVQKYYTVLLKKFARMVKIYIDSLIQVDGFPQRMFGDYVRLTRLIQNTDEEVAEEYLLKLLTIVRQIIPPDLQLNNSFVIDSNAVDVNKVQEG